MIIKVLSPDAFYRDKSAMVEGGVDGLLDKNCRVPNSKSRVDERIEDARLSADLHGYLL